MSRKLPEKSAKESRRGVSPYRKTMKTAAILLALCCLCHAEEIAKTNAALPGDAIIFPRPETGGEMEITAIWKSEKVLATVRQGNWITTEYLVTYEPAGGDKVLGGENLTFLCKDRKPAPESGIRVKKVPWPFGGGSMTFHLTRDESCRYMPYFNIIRYEPLLREGN